MQQFRQLRHFETVGTGDIVETVKVVERQLRQLRQLMYTDTLDKVEAVIMDTLSYIAG